MIIVNEVKWERYMSVYVKYLNFLTKNHGELGSYIFRLSKSSIYYFPSVVREYVGFVLS